MFPLLTASFQSSLLAPLLRRKGALWCDGTMKKEKNDNTNHDEEDVEVSPPTEKQRKPSASDKRHERVQALYEDLKTKHGPSRSNG